MTLTYSDSRLQPLTTPAEVEARVAALVGGAPRRQLWLLFLDRHDVQLPLVMPIDDIDEHPLGDEREVLAACLADLVDAADAAAMIIVVERPGPAALMGADRAWARVLHGACGDAGVPLRGVLLAHADGLRWLAQRGEPVRVD